MKVDQTKRLKALELENVRLKRLLADTDGAVVHGTGARRRGSADVELASVYGRCWSSRITGMLRNEGWNVNHKRAERSWRHTGLKLSKKQTRRGRLWPTDGTCVKLRSERRDHVWAYDFVLALRARNCYRGWWWWTGGRASTCRSTW